MLSSVPARLQRTLEREAGADLGLLGDRLQLRFTAFDRATRDGYLRFPIPPSSGLTNLHFISWNSRGQEWSLATPRRAAGPVEVEGTFSWSSAVTRITHMEAPAFSTTLVGGSRARFERDQQFGALYAYGYTYADANDDGVIDATEITLLPESVRGSTQPTHLLAATLAVHWGARVSAGLTLDGKSGHVRADLSERLACQYLVCEDLYRADASLAEQARAVVSGYSSAFSGPVHEGDFIRARDLWVRVALKPEWFRAGAASLTLAVRNAATWTKYPGTDPEVGSFVYATVQRGDYLVPGLARQFSLRLDVTP